MGGKNPAIVSALADLDVAAAGVARSAFGLSGQKCSACSRVYVQRDVFDAFVAKLAERAGSLVGRRPDVARGVPRAGDQRRVGRPVRAGGRARAVRRRGGGRRVGAARREARCPTGTTSRRPW